jgi:hypothetical protein
MELATEYDQKRPYISYPMNFNFENGVWRIGDYGLGFLFNDLKKGKVESVVNTELGEFTLMTEPGKTHFWNKKENKISTIIRGTKEGPASDQIEFLKRIEKTLADLSVQITETLRVEFEELEIPVNFRSWPDEFKLTELEILPDIKTKGYWSMTFKNEYVDTTIHIKDGKLSTSLTETKNL